MSLRRQRLAREADRAIAERDVLKEALRKAHTTLLAIRNLDRGSVTSRMAQRGLDATHEDVLLLVRLGVDAGGRVDPLRIVRRPATSASRVAFMEAIEAGLLDWNGYVTTKGACALTEWYRP